MKDKNANDLLPFKKQRILLSKERVIQATFGEGMPQLTNKLV